jgi:hypothetical protein
MPCGALGIAELLAGTSPAVTVEGHVLTGKIAALLRSPDRVLGELRVDWQT